MAGIEQELVGETHVTIVEEAPQLLGQENPGAAHHLEERFRSIGIELHLGRKATRFTSTPDGVEATLDNDQTVRAEVVLVATGRKPRVDGLGLDRAGIKPTKKGIPIDEHCRAADGVWALGDVTGVAGFTHVADYQCSIVSANIQGNTRSATYSYISAVTYTDPEIASVGVSDEKKAPKGMEIMSAHADCSASARTATYGKDYQGGLQLFADRQAKVLIGAWAVGPIASEWIQLATLAIRARVPLEVLNDTIFAFPASTSNQ